MQQHDGARGPDLRREAAAAKSLVEAMQTVGYDADDVRLTVESETDFCEAVSATVRRLAELEQLERGCRALAVEYESRARKLGERQEILRDRVVEALEESGCALPLRVPAGTLALARGAVSAVVTSPAELPAEYVRVETVRVPLLRDIAAALKREHPVPGAVLRNGRPHLQVRVL